MHQPDAVGLHPVELELVETTDPAAPVGARLDLDLPRTTRQGSSDGRNRQLAADSRSTSNDNSSLSPTNRPEPVSPVRKRAPVSSARFDSSAVRT